MPHPQHSQQRAFQTETQRHQQPGATGSHQHIVHSDACPNTGSPVYADSFHPQPPQRFAGYSERHVKTGPPFPHQEHQSALYPQPRLPPPASFVPHQRQPQHPLANQPISAGYGQATSFHGSVPSPSPSTALPSYPGGGTPPPLPSTPPVPPSQQPSSWPLRLPLPPTASVAAADISTSERVIASRFRTKLCAKWMASGNCSYDARCMFAHGEAELRTAEMNLQDGLTSADTVRAFKRHLHLVSVGIEVEPPPCLKAVDWTRIPIPPSPESHHRRRRSSETELQQLPAKDIQNTAASTTAASPLPSVDGPPDPMQHQENSKALQQQNESTSTSTPPTPTSLAGQSRRGSGRLYVHNPYRKDDEL